MSKQCQSPTFWFWSVLLKEGTNIVDVHNLLLNSYPDLHTNIILLNHYPGTCSVSIQFSMGRAIYQHFLTNIQCNRLIVMVCMSSVGNKLNPQCWILNSPGVSCSAQYYVNLVRSITSGMFEVEREDYNQTGPYAIITLWGNAWLCDM